MKKRRSFSREFKREAAAMVLDQAFSYREVCRQLDFGETGLQRWVGRPQFERDGVWLLQEPNNNLKWCPLFIGHYNKVLFVHLKIVVIDIPHETN